MKKEINSSTAKTTYQYQYHGRVVTSEIALPDLISVPQGFPTDVWIKLGELPQQLDGQDIIKRPFLTIDHRVALFDIPDIGRILIKEGKEIIIDLWPKVDRRYLQQLLVGYIFTACLHQLEVLQLHASAVVVNGCGVLFVGESGMGKSTTVAALTSVGYPLLSDDVTVVNFQNDAPFISSANPRVRLWEDSLKEIDTLKNEDAIWLKAFKKKGHAMKKFGVDLRANFQLTAVPLKMVYHFKKHKDESETIELIQKTKIESVAIITQNVSKPELLESIGSIPSFLQKCVHLSKQVAVKEIIRPEKKFSNKKLIQLLEKDFQNAQCLRN